MWSHVPPRTGWASRLTGLSPLRSPLKLPNSWLPTSARRRVVIRWRAPGTATLSASRPPLVKTATT